jgi:hypothetical protein
VAVGLEQCGQGFAHRGFVIDDQDSFPHYE